MDDPNQSRSLLSAGASARFHPDSTKPSSASSARDSGGAEFSARRQQALPSVSDSIREAPEMTPDEVYGYFERICAAQAEAAGAGSPEEPLDSAEVSNLIKDQAQRLTFQAMNDSSFLPKLKISKFRCVRFASMGALPVTFLIAPAQLMYAMDTAAFSVNVPLMAESLNLPTSQVQWLIHTEILIFMFLGAFAARLGDKYGITKCFLVGNWVFAIFTIALTFFDKSFGLLILIRILASTGLAVMLPLSTPTAYMFVRRDRLPMVLGLNMTLLPLGLFINSIAAGALANIHWRYVFLLNGVLSILFCVIQTIFIPWQYPRGIRSVKVDIIGALLLGIGLCLLVFGASSLAMDDVPKAVAPITLVLGILIVVAFGFWSFYKPTGRLESFSYSRVAPGSAGQPRRRTLRQVIYDAVNITTPLFRKEVFNRSYCFGIVSYFILMLAQYGEKFYIAYIFIVVYEVNKTLNGVFMALPALLTCVASPFIAMLYKRLVARYVLIVCGVCYGAVLIVQGLTLGINVYLTMSLTVVTAQLILFFIINFASFSMANAPRQYASSIGTINNIAQCLGHSMGVGLCVTIQSMTFAQSCSTAECLANKVMYAEKYGVSIGIADVVMAVLLVLAGVLGVFIGVVKADRGKLGFTERALARSRNFQENIQNSSEMVELTRENPDEANRLDTMLVPEGVYITWL